MDAGNPPPNPNANEVHDRIDFVYYKAGANIVPVEALNIGHDINDGFTDIAVQPYPSDHRAVIVEFDLDYSIRTRDFDSDGDVDGRDLLVWQRGESPDSLSADDLALWQATYGAGTLIANVDVPEPTTGILVMLGFMASLNRCRLARY